MLVIGRNSLLPLRVGIGVFFLLLSSPFSYVRMGSYSSIKIWGFGFLVAVILIIFSSSHYFLILSVSELYSSILYHQFNMVRMRLIFAGFVYLRCGAENVGGKKVIFFFFFNFFVLSIPLDLGFKLWYEKMFNVTRSYFF